MLSNPRSLVEPSVRRGPAGQATCRPPLAVVSVYRLRSGWGASPNVGQNSALLVNGIATPAARTAAPETSSSCRWGPSY